MELTFVGLGRMGGAMTAHLVEKGFTVNGFDNSEEARTSAAENGVQVHDSLRSAVEVQKSNPKLIWLMVPSKYVDDVLRELKPQISEGDVVIDGGNSFYKDSVRRHKELAEHNIHFIDCGVSGGMEGARTGASLMVGGDHTIVSKYDALFTVLATENGYARVGNAGAGHFVKMVHNGIEYGMMNAIAEGFAVLEKADEAFALDIQQILKPYKNGSIISSSLTSWLADAYHTEGYLDSIAGTVPQGETEEEMEHLIGIHSFKSLETALSVRKTTREQPSRVGVLLSAMRNQFGGHKTLDKNGD